MKQLLLIIKGLFIGIANIIPGVSGGTLAIILGIYEDLINVITHFFKNFKDNIKFILFIGTGAVLAILLGSKLISMCLDKFQVQTILFFTGLILGGMPMLFKKVKNDFKVSNIGILLITLLLVLGIGFINSSKEVSLINLNILGYLKLFMVGIIAAATMIIPGISGSFVLMSLGYYEPIIRTINDLTSFNNIISNVLILIPFGMGILLGIVGIAKIIEYLFKKVEIKTYFGIIGFVIASVIGILMKIDINLINCTSVIIGLILSGIGFVIAYKLGD